MDNQTSILENHDFVVDCARYAEGLLSEKEVKKKHHFDDQADADVVAQAIPFLEDVLVLQDVRVRERREVPAEEVAAEVGLLVAVARVAPAAA
jgi:hypothetical protein